MASLLKFESMKIISLTLCLTLSCSQVNCQSTPTRHTKKHTPTPERQVSGTCECCEAWQEGLPGTISWQTTIPPPGEPGEALEISGTIFQNDEKTPAQGVILYVYHTDYKGNYSRGKGSGCARRHGLLRGWMKTGTDGKYLFRTIKPASYPGTTIEAHIHPIIKEPGVGEYWIDEFLFDNDPLLTDEARSRQQQRGGPGIINLSLDKDGVWKGSRDIILGKNIPGY
jgi:protocatechuate 3,4-dioxygenase beta subunit